MARAVDVGDTDDRLAEVARWAESTHERVVIHRNGKVVAEIVPVGGSDAEEPGPPCELPPWVGLFADHPEICDSIDEVYRDRQTQMPPPPLPHTPTGRPSPSSR